MQKIRKGRYIKTIIRDEYSDMEFHEIDNLDTKSINEAENNYEATFITIRDALKEQEGTQLNLASESARLSITQTITDLLKKGRLIRKD